MGSPEKPLDVEMGDMSDETNKLNPEVKTEGGPDGSQEETRFTGLKKEELLAISNQPKWVRARWVLFIIFWLAWIGMLVGAILIVVNAPRCKPEPTPQWYQDTVVYEADVKQFAGDFKGVEDHLPYIGSLNAKTILLAGAANPVDQRQVLGGKTEAFNKLLKKAKDKSFKVVIDLVIDTMSTASSYFNSSSEAACKQSPSGNMCDFFAWQNNATSTLNSGGNWFEDLKRNQSYEAKIQDRTQAFINYGSPQALPYLLEMVGNWINLGVDGVQIRDIDGIRGKSFSTLLQEVWKFTNLSDTRALFAYSTNGMIQENQFFNVSNVNPAPIVINADITTKVGQASSGKLIRSAIEKLRNTSQSIGGYTTSPFDKSLAAAQAKNYSAGLVILSICLPGVPIIRSGDEAGLSSGDFNWTGITDTEHAPVGASTELVKAVQELTVRRVAGIQAMQSLRYDTRDGDTQFSFIDTGSDDVVAFVRKWSTKPGVLVVSNLSPNSRTVNVAKPMGLKNSDDKPLDKAKVLVSSTSTVKQGDSLSLEELKIASGVTLIFGK